MIHLRALEPDDTDFMYAAEQDCAAWQYSDYLAPLSKEQLRQYAFTYDADPFGSGQLRLIIEKDGRAIGMADLFEVSPRHLRAETGIYLLPQERGAGIGSDALGALCNYCRERLGLHQLTATVSKHNEAARRCYMKAGFSLTGRRRDWLRTYAGYEDAELYSLILNNP